MTKPEALNLARIINRDAREARQTIATAVLPSEEDGGGYVVQAVDTSVKHGESVTLSDDDAYYIARHELEASASSSKRSVYNLCQRLATKSPAG